jgi:serine/threonine protein kinase
MDKAESPLVQVFRHGWLQLSDRLIHPSTYYIDMELGGQTLADYINELNHLTSLPLVSKLWGIFQQITAGVGFIHERKMIHRDLKPENSITLLGVFLR